MRIAKTNTGVDFFKNIEHKNQGSPDLRTKKSELGRVVDIRFPDTEMGRNGLQVIITFDNPKLGTPPFWFSLAEDAGMILSSVGNREAVLAAPPRVSYTYQHCSFYQGIAKIVCDNSYGTYTKYQNNQTNNVVGPVANLATGASPPGADVAIVKFEPLAQSTSIAPKSKLPEKLTPEQWQEYQIQEIQKAEAAGKIPGQGGGMLSVGNMSYLRDYSVYEEIYRNHLRNGTYDQALKEAAMEAAMVEPKPINNFEESTPDINKSVALDQKEYIRQLQGL